MPVDIGPHGLLRCIAYAEADFRVDDAGYPTGLRPLKARVMNIARGIGDRAAVSDVFAQMLHHGGNRPLAYSTVKTVLQDLANEGHRKNKTAVTANVFNVVLTREVLQSSVIQEVVGPLLRTQRDPVFARIAGDLAVDTESYAEFEQFLTSAREIRLSVRILPRSAMWLNVTRAAFETMADTRQTRRISK